MSPKHLFYTLTLWSGTLLLPVLQSCTAGNSNGSDTSPTEPLTELGQVLTFEDDAVSASIGRVRVAAVTEDSAQLLLSGNRSDIDGEWLWGQPYQSGALPDCAAVDGFRLALSASTLEAACSRPDNCQLAVEQTQSGADLAFRVSVPQLRAPVGLAYRLTAVSKTGETLTDFVTLCAVSVNEAPTAGNDSYTVRHGETLSITSDTAFNLLANDVDDDDINNSPLTVLSMPVSPPQHAASFELANDGGFVYQSTTDTAITRDSFTYQVTDGIHVATATVELRYAASNQPPLQHTAIPALEVKAGTVISSADTRFHLLSYFSDPDQDALTISVQNLPLSGNLFLDSTGRLLGQPEAEDAGVWPVAVTVTDGRDTVSAQFSLTINEPDEVLPANRAPSVSPIADRTLLEGQSTTIMVVASDADGDALTYSLVPASPSFVTINALTGVISVESAVSGSYQITVAVDDGMDSATATFMLRVDEDDSDDDDDETDDVENNSPPEVSDIANRNVRGVFDYDVSQYFSDPDNDTLSFTATNLPTGLQLSTTGVLSGDGSTPKGRYLISVTAEDGRGGSVADSFRLLVQQSN